jgi:hypothetical protein
MEPLFAEHASGFVPCGIHKHCEDARAFATFLARTPHTVPAEIADLGRYEATWLSLQQGSGWASFQLLRCDPRAFFHSSPLSAAVGRRWTLATWFRIAGRIRHVVLRIW